MITAAWGTPDYLPDGSYPQLATKEMVLILTTVGDGAVRNSNLRLRITASRLAEMSCSVVSAVCEALDPHEAAWDAPRVVAHATTWMPILAAMVGTSLTGPTGRGAAGRFFPAASDLQASPGGRMASNSGRTADP